MTQPSVRNAKIADAGVLSVLATEVWLDTYEHVLKHRPEPCMVIPDCSIKIGAVHQTSSLRAGDGVLHAHSDGSSLSIYPGPCFLFTWH